MRWEFVLLTFALMGGCLTGTTPASGGDGPLAPADHDLLFSEPVQVNAKAQEGFEPSLRIAPDGTVYVAAARGFLAGEDRSLASPIWYSKDAGLTWHNLPSDISLRERVKAIEGELAVDANGVVYFVDTYMADNVITVWEADQSWRETRFIQGTTGLDDRPWLAAHGDGVLYYLGNSAASLPAPDPSVLPPDSSRIWFYRSTDAGTTWSLGHAFPAADYCHVAASPVDDRTVAVACTPAVGVRVGLSDSVVAYVSGDRGVTWDETVLGPAVPSPGTNYPSVAFSPNGEAFAFWVDDGTPSTLHLWAWDGVDWSKSSVPESEVRAANPWVAAGSNGSVGLAFYGHDGDAWSLHAWKRSDVRNWSHWTDPEPVSRGPCPPEDFFQAAFDGDARLNIVYQRDPGRMQCGGVKPALQPVVYVRELA